MTLTSEKISSVQSYVRKKLEKFQSSHKDLELQEEDIELLTSSLITGQIKDLGGLIALRGFVYQYYVAMNYMIDMLHPSGAWWDAVAFELLDDIVLLKENGIRFVQVKTGREDGRHKIKPGDLYNRKRELNSWLDKLFLNIPYYEQQQEDTEYKLNIDGDFKVEFEVATNYPTEYDHYLEPYFMNSKFNLSDTKKHLNDDLLERLQKPQDIYEKKENKYKKIGTKYLADELAPFNIQWCLQRLHINNFGYFSHLEKLVKYKIQDILDENDPALSSAIAECILQSLLAMVVSRTHDDSPHINKRELIFTKDELEKLFTIWKKEAETRIYEASKQKVLLAKFTSCVDELRELIQFHWKGETQIDILDRLNWIYLQLSDRFRAEGDIDTYEKFLNRLFEMRNHNVPISLEKTPERQHLINSLKYMAICLSFYTEQKFPYKDSNLLFKQGISSNEDSKTFVTFNAREQIEFDTAKRRLVQTVKRCPESQKIREDYYCIIIDSQEDTEEETDPFASFVEISTVENNKRITDVPPNVHFVNPKELRRIVNSLQKKPHFNFQDQQVREVFNKAIEKNNSGDDTN